MPLAAIMTISPSISSNFSSSLMMPASIMRLMSSTVNARRGKPSAAVVTAMFMTISRFDQQTTTVPSARLEPRQEPHGIVTIDVAHIGLAQPQSKRSKLLRHFGAGAAWRKVGPEHDMVAGHELEQRGDCARV